MKKIAAYLLAIALTLPCVAQARDIEEYEVDSTAAQDAPAAPAKAKAAEPQKAEKAAKPAPSATAAAPKAKSQPPKETYAPPKSHSSSFATGREGKFRLGLIGPGLGVANRGYDAFMTMGVEGEYFIWDPLSVSLRFEVGTKFESPTLISIVPRARYVWDMSNPRWSVYAQGGVGVMIAAGGGTVVMADIAIPGGGFWWQWTDSWSVGADASMHIYVQDFVGVGFNIGPAIRYQF